MRLVAASLLALPLAAGAATAALPSYVVRGDAIPASLTGSPGDATRGRAIVAERTRGLCLLCHAGPFDAPQMQGNLAPDLRGAGARWSEGQLRLRIVDMRRVVPGSVMPSFYRVRGLTDVGATWQGRPILSASEVEDVVAFLRTLKEV
ncbi:MAG: sulfur oxidation c-type cytochrome SoxX [Steroidobacteraceae bacterium]